MGIGDYYEREAKKLLGDLVKVLFILLVLCWPVAVIDGEAFSPRPNWWQWALGVFAEVLWLLLLGAVFYGRWKSRHPIRSDQRVTSAAPVVRRPSPRRKSNPEPKITDRVEVRQSEDGQVRWTVRDRRAR